MSKLFKESQILRFIIITCALLLTFPCIAQYKSFSLPDKPTNFALSENGQYLVLTCEASNNIYILETASKNIVKTLSCPSPRHVICRKTDAYISSFGHGSIHKVSLETLETTESYKIPNDFPFYLSAAKGTYFDDKIIVSCAREYDLGYLELDCKTRASRRLFSTNGTSVLSLNYKGTQFLLQSELECSFSGHPRFWGPYSGISSNPPRTGHLSHLPIVAQYREDGLWFGGNGAYGSFPPSAVGSNKAILIAADILANRVYQVDFDHISANEDNVARKEIARWTMPFPRKPGPRGVTKTKKTFCNNIGVVLNEKLHLFIRDPVTKVIYYCDLSMNPPQNEHKDQSKKGLAFSPLPLSGPAKAMCISEDGKYLFIPYQSSDTIEVWDVVGEKVITKINSPSPAGVMSRKGVLYVANWGKGTVSAYSHKGWGLINQYLVGSDKVFYLSAPKGTHFTGQILASCMHSENPWGLYRLLDCNIDESRKVHHSSSQASAIVSYNGKHVIIHQGGNTGNETPIFDYRGLISQDQIKPLGSSKMGVAEQLHESDFWIGRQELLAGLPLSPFVKVMDDRHLVPDITRRSYFEVTKEATALKALSTDGELIFRYPIALPTGIGKKAEQYSPYVHTAATHGKSSYIFLIGNDRLIYSCKLPSIPLSSLAKGPLADQIFQLLPLPEASSSMALTEDGRFLICSHPDANSLSVWDVGKQRLDRVIPCSGPGPILCRGNRFFVANRSNGILNEFSTETWSLSSTYPSDISGMNSISAPGGRFFDEKILISSGTDGKPSCWELDLRTNSLKRIIRQSTCDPINTYSYDGTYVVQQNKLGFTATWKEDFFDPDNTFYSTCSKLPSVLQQVQESNYWFNFKGIFAGVPPSKLRDKMGILAPDVTRNMFYAINPGSVSLKKQNYELDEVLKVTIKPSPIISELSNLHPNSVEACQAIASSMHGYGHIFVLLGKRKLIYTCRVPTGMETAAIDASTAAPKTNSDLLVTGGELLTFPILGKEQPGEYNVLIGPKGVTISKEGILSWQAPKEDGTTYRLKVRSKVGDKPSFHRYNIRLIKAAEKSVDESIISSGKYRLFNKDVDIQDSLDRASIIINAGNNVKVLNSTGTHILSSFTSPKKYKRIFLRGKTFICLGRTTLDLRNSSDFELLKSIPLPTVFATDCALHTNAAVTYVTLQLTQENNEPGLLSNRLCKVEEDTGKVTPIDNAYGTGVIVDPTGRYLFTELSGTMEGEYLYGPGKKPIPLGRTVDILMAYDLVGTTLKQREYNPGPGIHGKGLRITPDGNYVVYLARFWEDVEELLTSASTFHLFSAKDITKPDRTLNLPFYPKRLSFHPKLDIFAGTDGRSVILVSSKSGGQLKGKLKLPSDISQILDLHFTPSGNALAMCYEKGLNQFFVRLMELGLNQADIDKIKAEPTPPAWVEISPDRLDQKETGKLISGSTKGSVPVAKLDIDLLNGIGPALKKPISTRDLAKQYMDSVVVIKHTKGSGTGFFISTGGHILTCAHVIPVRGETTVSYRIKGKHYAATAGVISINRKRDLALLKIEPAGNVISTRLPSKVDILPGGTVAIIGHPGLGNQILDYTMTDGIVSNPKRLLMNMSYIQTNASVNPGVSGGPMFDGNGNVIGVVVLKAYVEGIAMAVPHGDIMRFLKDLSE